MTFVTVNNTILDPSKVTCVTQDEDDADKIIVMYDNGHTQTFRGAEGREVWKLFDDGHWSENE